MQEIGVGSLLHKMRGKFATSFWWTNVILLSEEGALHAFTKQGKLFPTPRRAWEKGLCARALPRMVLRLSSRAWESASLSGLCPRWLVAKPSYKTNVRPLLGPSGVHAAWRAIRGVTSPPASSSSLCIFFCSERPRSLLSSPRRALCACRK